MPFFLSETQLNREVEQTRRNSTGKRQRFVSAAHLLYVCVHPFAGANDLEMINKETVPVP